MIKIGEVVVILKTGQKGLVIGRKPSADRLKFYVKPEADEEPAEWFFLTQLRKAGRAE